MMNHYTSRVYCVNKTIKENLSFGNEDLNQEQIVNACKISLANEFIGNLEEKFDFMVGIKGGNLSGGQKQRLAIARAILRNPRILILDEATSALDNKNEKEIYESLGENFQNLTTIVIAHRLTTIMNADTIIAMKQGEIIEIGSHQELITKGGYYSTLFNKKFDQNIESKEGIDKFKKKDKIQNSYCNKENIIKEDNKSYRSTPNGKIEALNLSNYLETNNINYSHDLPNRINPEYILNKENVVEKKKEETPITHKKKILDFITKRKILIFVSIAAALNGTVSPVFAIILSKSIDALSNPDLEKVKIDGFFMSMMFLIIAIIAGALNFFQFYNFTKIGEILCKNLRSEVFNKYLQLHLGFFDDPKNTPGALITTISYDTSKLNGIIRGTIGITMQSLLSFILGFILGFIYDWRLSLILLASVPFIAISAALHNKFFKVIIEDFKDRNIKSGEILSESVINTDTIFIFNMQKKIVYNYEEKLMKEKFSLFKQSLKSGVFIGLLQFFIYLSFFGIAYSGGLFIAQKTLTIENLMKTIVLILFSILSVGEALFYIGDISQAIIFFKNIFSILDAPSSINPLDEGNKKKKDASQIKGKIEFRKVSFHYPTKPKLEVLKNISFIILPGQNVAFEGISGSGKSTILQLIERFYDCDSGEILIDDVNIKDYDLISLRKRIGIVLQEPNIFKRSVADNISYGKLGSSIEDIKEAAIKANIGDFFANEKTGEKDENVSGGQKQRISIARAILKDPRILLLDEATSALDKNSESGVQNALNNASQNRTTVTVAHRLATIEKCDVIFVLNQGVIVEKGTHQQLLAIQGHYYKQYICSDLYR